MAEANDNTTWKRCSSCKKPIAFGQSYFECNVSTCNRRNTNFVFCQVTCWDAHVPTMNHRDCWAVDKRAPTKEQWEKDQIQVEAQKVKMETQSARETKPKQGVTMSELKNSDIPKDILIVASKLKGYIRVRSGMNTSADVLDALSGIVRKAADDAVIRAQHAGRKTLMARDFSSI